MLEQNVNWPDTYSALHYKLQDKITSQVHESQVTSLQSIRINLATYNTKKKIAFNEPRTKVNTPSKWNPKNNTDLHK